jgi:hypothetical protein
MAHEPDPRDLLSRISAFLSHPAFLIVLTAAATGVLAPYITSSLAAHDKQVQAASAAAAKELAVESQVVNQIGTASAGFLSAIELGVVTPSAGAQAQSEYRAMRTASFEIESELAAYFTIPKKGDSPPPESQPIKAWGNYTFSLRNLYLVLTTAQGAAREPWINWLNKYFDYPPKKLAALCDETAKQKNAFPDGLRELTLAFQNHEQAIVGNIMASPTTLTGTPTAYVNSGPLKHWKKNQPPTC